MNGCPICNATADKLERLRDEAKLCTECGHAFRLGADGALKEWWTTNKSEQKALERAMRAASMVALIVLAVLVSSCAAAAHAAAETASAPKILLLSDDYDDVDQVCVPAERPTSRIPFACMRLGDLRRQLRDRRFAIDLSSQGDLHAQVH